MKVALWIIFASLIGYILIIYPHSRKNAEPERNEEVERTKQLEEIKQRSTDLDKEIAFQKAKVKLQEERAFRERKEAREEAAKAKMDGSAANAVSDSSEKAKTSSTEAAGSSAFQKHADKLFTVSSNGGNGSGFICEIGGKPVAVTNAHVISGASQLQFTKPDGKRVEVIPDQLQVGMDRDLVYFPLKAPQESLKPASGKINIGDEIVCLGNSGGKAVITELPGKVIGVGADTIEVDSEVIQGNSGCPVIKSGSGEVVGVVTRATREDLNWSNEGTRFEKTRKFCLKLEGAKWTPLGWTAFAAEATLIGNYRAHRGKLNALLQDLAAGTLSPTGYDAGSVTLRAAVRTYLATASNYSVSHTDRVKAATTFLREVEFEIRKGPFDSIEDMRAKSESMCSYHKEQLAAEISVRETASAKIKSLTGAVITVGGTKNR